MKDFSDLIGLTIEQAIEKAKDRGIVSIRPRVVDGEHMMGTMDYRTNRLNVGIDGGVITSIGNIG